MPPADNTGIFAHAAHMLMSIGILSNILVAVSIMMGLGLFIGGLFFLKRFSEMRSMMSQQITLWGPMSALLAGTALLLLPVVVRTSLGAFFGMDQTSPLAYHTSTNASDFEAYMPVVQAFVRLVGVGAIIRACMLFSRAGKSSGAPGTIGKALLHLFGGILCVHILGTTHLIENIFDI